MTLEYTLHTIQYCCKYADFHHTHTQLNQNNYFYDVCPLLHVKLVRYSEIKNALSCDFGTAEVKLVDRLLHSETEATKIAGD